MIQVQEDSLVASPRRQSSSATSAALGITEKRPCSAIKSPIRKRACFGKPGGTSNNESELQLQRSLTCPICLELFYKPVTLACGHSYCRGCIMRYDDLHRSSKRSSTMNGSERASSGPASEATRDKSEQNRKPGQAGKPCPTCRKPCIDVTQLCESVSLNDMLQRCFPEHVQKREIVSHLKGKKVWISFMQSRQSLLQLTKERETLKRQIGEMHEALRDKVRQHKVVVAACHSEYTKAKMYKTILDTEKIDPKKAMPASASTVSSAAAFFQHPVKATPNSMNTALRQLERALYALEK